MGDYVSSAADQIDRLSRYVRSTKVDDMLGGVERFAREQPAAFVGGAFMVGLLAARFLKSSRRSGHSQYGSYGSQRPEDSRWAGEQRNGTPASSSSRMRGGNAAYGTSSASGYGGSTAQDRYTSSSAGGGDTGASGVGGEEFGGRFGSSSGTSATDAGRSNPSQGAFSGGTTQDRSSSSATSSPTGATGVRTENKRGRGREGT
jgi:hypothetical protein